MAQGVHILNSGHGHARGHEVSDGRGSNMQEKQQKIVAAFDFDGTITSRDTLPSFLIYSAGKKEAMQKLLRLSPAMFAYLCGIVSRQDIKERVLKSFFKGISLTQLERLGSAFSTSPSLNKLLSTRALKRLEWHKKQNHTCVLISASIDVYLKPWAKKAGFDEIICSTIEADENGIVSGNLRGRNCWGQEKSTRLEEHLGTRNMPRNSYTLFAYGDSRGDLELLSMADHPFYRYMP